MTHNLFAMLYGALFGFSVAVFLSYESKWSLGKCLALLGMILTGAASVLYIFDVANIL